MSLRCPYKGEKKAKTFFASIEKTFLVCTFCFPITDRVTVPQRTVSFNCRPVHVHPTCICIHDNEKRKDKFPREYHVVRIRKTKHAAKEVYSKNIWVKHKSIKTCTKIAAHRHICFLYLARTKVEWDRRARWTPHARKWVRATLSTELPENSSIHMT